MPIAVSIVDDDMKTSTMLAQVVRDTSDLRLVSVHNSGDAALHALPDEKPDVVLMDVNMPDTGGIDCVRLLRPLLTEAQFLMLTVYEDTENIFNALAAGATGYLLKSTRRDDLVAAITQIYHGGSPMSSAIARKVVQSFAAERPAPTGAKALSAREQQVLDLLVRGYLYKEISDSLGLSMITVGTYVRRIYEKLQVHSRNQIVARYYRKGR